jgi:hypothetical protein
MARPRKAVAQDVVPGAVVEIEILWPHVHFGDGRKGLRGEVYALDATLAAELVERGAARNA